MDTPDPKDVVRRGYDAASLHYRADDADEAEYGPGLDSLRERLPDGAAVLDLGCGCGVPVARSMSAAGHDVTGVDLSEVQIERARRLVPGAVFIRADATEVTFEPESFHAVVCLYALIHIPLDEQPPLLARIVSWLRPGGWMLATTGETPWTGTEDRWLDSDATMWWSHADGDTYRQWITEAGLVIDEERFVPEGASGHRLFWARKA